MLTSSNSAESNQQHSAVRAKLDKVESEARQLQNETANQLHVIRDEITTTIKAFQLQSRPVSSSTENLDNSPSLSNGSLGKIGILLVKLQNVTTSIYSENHILQRLMFSLMYQREDSISDVTIGTFAWMVDENDNKTGSQQKDILEDDEETVRQRTRQAFMTWLNSGSHVFHISGKAGASKSTLMEFLGQSPRVQQELQCWTGDKQLIFAQFYFWDSGDKFQMTLEGLYRHLLFKVLRQCPRLIPWCFPGFWNNLASGTTPSYQAPFRFEEIKAAFNCLMSEKVTSSHRICLFIDGLDEYEGDEVDHWRICHDLQSWTNSENVKLCISSRPHIPFLHSFATDMNIQIQIHQLTQRDIRKFGLAMFEMDPNFERVKHAYRYLVDEIEKLSKGVFLWARLVVRSLLKGIGYRVTLEYLTKKLHTISKELNKLFGKMLDSVDLEDRVLSDKLFLVVALAQQSAPKAPPLRNALLYRWLEDLDDPRFPLNRSMRAYSDSEIEECIQDVTCLIDRLSRGLLEVVQQPHQQDKYFAFEIRFIHRTAYYYILNTQQPQMQKRTIDFDIKFATIRLLLTQLKHARARPADLVPSPGVLCESRTLMYQYESTFDWMSAISRAGYAIPSQYLEEFGNVRDDYTYIQHPESQGVRWGTKMVTIYFVNLARSGRLLSYLCWLLQYGLEHHLLPSTLGNLELKAESQHTNNNNNNNNINIGDANLLLTAAICYRTDFVRRLIRKGRTPAENMDVYLSDFRRSGPPRVHRTTVWIVFLWYLVDTLLNSIDDAKLPCLVLEDFLDCRGLCCDVLFVIRSRQVERKAKGESSLIDNPPKTYSISLLEAVELRTPPNVETLRTKLREKNPWWCRNQLGAKLTPWSGVRSGREYFNLKHRGLPTKDVHSKSDLYLDSIITKTNRLDAPFVLHFHKLY